MRTLVRFSTVLILLAFGLSSAPCDRAESVPEDTTISAPRFEIVSIKPYPRNYWPPSSYMEFTPDGFNARNMIIQPLVVYAYDLHDPRFMNRQRLIQGGEKWMLWDWFDIQAKMSEDSIAALKKLGPHDRDVYKRELIQTMLADRLKLKVHHVARDSQAWELVVAGGGPKNMKPAPEDEEARPFPSDLNHISWQGAPIAMLIALLTDLEHVPVLDRT